MGSIHKYARKTLRCWKEKGKKGIKLRKSRVEISADVNLKKKEYKQSSDIKHFFNSW